MNERVKFDFYETPAWQTAALRRRVQISGSVLECCVGDGSLAKMLPDCSVVTNDIDPNRSADFHLDAAKPESWSQFPAVDWVVTNPTFNAALPILRSAVLHAKFGVIFLLRISFMEPTLERQDFLRITPPRKANCLAALELQTQRLNGLCHDGLVRLAKAFLATRNCPAV